MAADCNRKNPLSRGGTNQGDRYRRALDPSSFGIDERSTADLIQFAARFSRHIRYYDSSNTAGGDWEPFFTTDISAVLAGLSNLPVASVQAFARALQDYLSEDPSRPAAELSAHFKLLFHLPMLLLVDAGVHFDLLPRNHELRSTLAGIVERSVDEPLRRLVAFHKGAIALADPPISDVALFENTPLDPGDYNTTFDDGDPRIQLPSAVTERISGLLPFSLLDVSDEMFDGIAPAAWSAYYSGVTADTAPYEDSVGSPYDQVADALTYNLLDAALEQLFQSIERMTVEAASYLDLSLTAHPDHTPHYGLWLAFLRLFKENQAQLNGLLGAHLDYYYRDVLRLCTKAARPDHVHLLFELQKTVDDHLLDAESTLFRAGKDESGKEILYRLDDDVVVNRAKVAALKAVYRPEVDQALGTFPVPYASEPPNSADGMGEELPKEEPQWPAFGPADGAVHARVGFALADRRLFMREGRRTIHLVVQSATALSAGLHSSAFRALLTTEDGWLAIEDPAKILSGSVLGFLIFAIELDGNDPAVVPYDEALHGEGFNVDEPVLKIEFRFDTELGAKTFKALKDLNISSSTLATSAGYVRNFTLQNESGAIDPSRPFLPFGPTPTKNSPLILGSSELFSKKLSSLKLHIEWAETMSTYHYRTPTAGEHQVRLRKLDGGRWTGAGGSYDRNIFATSGTTKELMLSDVSGLAGRVPQTIENPVYSPQSQSGFLRFELEKGFDHRAQLDAKTRALIEIAKGNTAWLPYEPYTPKINEMTLSYTSATDPPARLLHLHPFGFAEASASAGRLFPLMPYEGELLIGIADLKPPQRLTLLFQIVDGTANPLKEETALAWHYLRGDEWVDFNAQDVDDKTHNLTGSGIVGLAVPADADTSHSILPDGLHWIRMAASSDSDALNELLTIDAQAARATFVDQDNDPGVLEVPREQGAISKLKNAQAEVKKIAQPYASFGGRPAENGDQFSVRASERLRHKDRAVTMWDYEHLILQEFPGIYRARCINHTQLVRDLDKKILADNEVRPGHVLVVTIPYVEPESAIDRLRPYTDRRTLGEIDRFLRSRLSPFVELEVQNPKFEEVQVKFRVAFHPEVADITFYSSELNEAIIRHLSPWCYREGADISFGGKWHKSAIVDFIEEQPYVDYVTHVEMYHKADESLGDTEWPRIDEEVVAATTSRSVLVSHPAHIITEISKKEC